jgi:Ca2+-transporting ATPase
VTTRAGHASAVAADAIAPAASGPPWHAQSVAAAFAALRSNEAGLDAAEADARLRAVGANRLTVASRRGPLRRLLAQFHNTLIHVLVAAAVITAVLGHWVDSGVILGVVVINAVIGFLQEDRAERALTAIRELLSPTAVAVRGGHRVSVPAAALVPGDLVELKSGDRVPADLRLVAAHRLQTQESALTGESLPVEKSVQPVAASAELADRSCIAFAGTLVTAGRGLGLVAETGERTEIGRISRMLTEVTRLETPLLRQMRRFGRWLTLAILAMAAAVFLFGYGVRGYAAADMLIAAVGLAVAAIPEGLPAIMTITLAIGVTRMARRNAIIRLLPAVEALGSVSVICTDKTGTLTRNEMTVQTVVTAAGSYGVSGAGYAPDGRITRGGEAVEPTAHADLDLAVTAAVLCSDAELSERDGVWALHGDPTEGALYALALKAGHDPRQLRALDPRTGVIPFESEHKYMATVHRGDCGGGRRLLVKGAPERLLEMCDRQHHDGEDQPLDRSYWNERSEALGRAGMRVLAVACGDGGDHDGPLLPAQLGGGLSFVALFGLMDPPREEAVAAVARCREAGIRVKMITGDHVVTAGAIARRVGIGSGVSALTGRELDTLDHGEFARAAAETDVFARTTPEHKLRLVEALQAQGQVVAMTGDGVNDAPALKRADVGIAMGRKGTEAAKEAAEVVLADDNFASIAHAVEEGRIVYENLKKSILLILPTSAGEALTIAVAILAGQTLPITPVQVLWVNMITAVTLGLALAFERAEPALMTRRPRSPREPILSGFLVWRIGFVTLLLLAGTYGLFALALDRVGLDAARTIAVNALVAGEIAYLVNTRRIHAPAWTLDGLFGSRPVLIAAAAVLAFQCLFTYLPPLQTLFGTAAIDAASWLAIAGFAAAVFMLVELEKAGIRRVFRVSGP